jgi:hypothetical protein
MPEVETVLLTLDNIITDKATSYWQRRLAYQQLARVVASVERILTSRKHIQRPKGHRSPSPSAILLDTYVKALGGRSSQNDVRLRVRWAKRQSSLFGGSLFLLFAYSDQAETMMYVSPTKRETASNIYQIEETFPSESASWNTFRAKPYRHAVWLWVMVQCFRFKFLSRAGKIVTQRRIV